MDADRRRHPRFPCLVLGEVAPAGGAPTSVVCTSVSRGGAYFSCKSNPPPGAELVATLRPQGNTGLAIVAIIEIMRVVPRGQPEPPGFGARWKSVACVQGPEPLLQFVREQLRWPDPPTPEVDPAGLARFTVNADGVWIGAAKAPPAATLERRGPERISQGTPIALGAGPAAAAPIPERRGPERISQGVPIAMGGAPEAPVAAAERRGPERTSQGVFAAGSGPMFAAASAPQDQPAQARPTGTTPGTGLDPEPVEVGWTGTKLDSGIWPATPAVDEVPQAPQAVFAARRRDPSQPYEPLQLPEAAPAAWSPPPAPGAERTVAVAPHMVARAATGPNAAVAPTAVAPSAPPPAPAAVRAAAAQPAADARISGALPPAPANESTVAYQRSATSSTSIPKAEPQLPRPASRPEMVLLPGPVARPRSDWPAGVPTSLANRYRDLHHIGQGGSGVVYRGFDSILERPVVLKFLSQPRMTTEMAHRYFAREIKVAASLNHNHIVHIYDAGTADGVPYYAMEFVDGLTLNQYLPEGKPLTDMAFVYSVFAALCDALDYAHGLGILHRDIKPDNVLVSADGQIKLFDFGLAKLADQGFGEKSVLLGTPYYMAPEQLTGANVDHRADIYALGVTLYRMLTGVLPFRSGNIFAAHVLEAPPDPRTYNPALRPGLSELVLKMLAKQPHERFDACRPMALRMWSILFE